MNGTLEQGIAAARSGRKDEARLLLLQVLEADEQNEQAWLWLSGVTSDPREMRVCLENVLVINPENARARRGLEWLDATYGEQPSELTPATTTPPPDQPVNTVAAAAAESAALAQSPPAFPESPQEAAARQVEHTPAEPVPCIYCGAATSPAQTSCPSCRRSLLTRVGAREQRSPALVILAVMTGLSALSGIALGGLLFIGGILFSMIGSSPELMQAGMQDLPPGTTLPGGMDPLSFISMLGTIIYAIAIAMLIVGVLYIFVTIGLWRRRRWAYYVTCVLAGLSVLIALITVPLAIYAEGLSGNTVFSLLSTIAYVAVTMMSYGDFFGPQVRLLPEVSTNDAVGHYNSGVAFKNRGMWYMAVQEWAAAVQQSPKDVVYLHALGLAYAQIKHYDQARATLDTALSIAPQDARLAESRAFVDKLAGTAIT